MPTIADIRQAFPEYERVSDSFVFDDFHSRFASNLSKAELAKKLGFDDPRVNHLIDPAKAVVGSTLAGTGRALEDIGAESVGGAMRSKGEQIQQENPSYITSFEDFKSHPGTAIKESIGGMGAQAAEALGGGMLGAALGGVIGGPPGAALGGYLGGNLPMVAQEYGSGRTQQEEKGIDDPLRAFEGSLMTTAIENLGGFKPGGMGNIIADTSKSLAGKSLKEGGLYLGKEMLKAGASEAAEELPQQYTGAWGGGTDIKDLNTKENLQQGLLGAAMAFPGGAAFGGGRVLKDTYISPAQKVEAIGEAKTVDEAISLANNILNQPSEKETAKQAVPSQQKTMPQGMNILGDLIGKGEGSYTSINKGTSNGQIIGSGSEPSLIGMTIGQIKALQAQHVQAQNSGIPGQGLFAVGKYQFIPGTFDRAAAKAGLKDSDLFDPLNQEKMFMANLPDKVKAYINGSHNDLDGAIEALSREWASIPSISKNGASYYGEGNRASHSIDEVRNALQTIRNGGGTDLLSQAITPKFESGQTEPQAKEEKPEGILEKIFKQDPTHTLNDGTPLWESNGEYFDRYGNNWASEDAEPISKETNVESIKAKNEAPQKEAIAEPNANLTLLNNEINAKAHESATSLLNEANGEPANQQASILANSLPETAVPKQTPIKQDMSSPSTQAINVSPKQENIDINGKSDQDLFFDYKVNASRIDQELFGKAKLNDLIKFSGQKSLGSWEDLRIDDRANAYVKYVKSGNKPIVFDKPYNQWVTEKEQEAKNRQESGIVIPEQKPIKKRAALPTDELKQAITKLGGLKYKSDIGKSDGADRAGFTDFKKNRFLFHNGANAKTFDEMAEALRELGFNDIDGENTLIEKLGESLNGRLQFTPEGAAKHMEKMEEYRNDGLSQQESDAAIEIEEALDDGLYNIDDFDALAITPMSKKDFEKFLGVANDNTRDIEGQTSKTDTEATAKSPEISKETKNEPGDQEEIGLLQPQQKPPEKTAKKTIGSQPDLFVSENEEKALKNAQGFADLAKKKETKRQGNGQEGGELFQGYPGLAGQQDLADIAKEETPNKELYKQTIEVEGIGEIQAGKAYAKLQLRINAIEKFKECLNA